jgi:hypothetical protein
MKKEFKIKAKVWVYPGLGGWHFVTLDKKLSAEIKKVAKTYGSGFVKVEAKVGKTAWQTALFPHTKSGTYLLSIKKLVRKKEGILSDDEIRFTVELL